MHRCPECSAPLDEGRTCRDYFHDLLGLESQVPGGAGLLPHFFAVASYNLQHPSSFVPEVLGGLRGAVADALAGRATVDEIRRRASAATDGPSRVTRRPDDAGQSAAAPDGWPTYWPLTVRDACAVPAGEYAGHVRAWAASVSSTLEHAVPTRRS
jgi:hypothetical protein